MARKGHDLNIGAALPSGKQVEEVLEEVLNILFKKSELVVSPTYSPLLFLSSCKFVFTLHDLQELHFPENFSRQVLAWRGYIYKKLCKLTEFIITESSYVKTDIVNYLNYNPQRIIVAESPPIFDIEEVDGDFVKKKYKIKEGFDYVPWQLKKAKRKKRKGISR